MTVIVSDTSPINYLVLIGAIDILPQLFDEILIPPAVKAELGHSRTPPAVYRWASALPSWAKIQAPARIDQTIELGHGEREAISLAVELRIPAILMDDWQGRQAAELRGILPVGTLNILIAADRRGLLDFEQVVDRLRQTNFHIAPPILEALLADIRARKPGAAE